MRRLKIVIAVGILSMTPMPFRAQQTGTTKSDETAIRAVVQRYLHGLKFNDVESLKSAFHPDAKLFFVDDHGGLGMLSQAEWYEQFKGSAGHEEQGELKIVALDVTGNASAVKVYEEYPNSTYTDYVSLLRLNGEWRIVNKSYYSAPRQR